MILASGSGKRRPESGLKLLGNWKFRAGCGYGIPQSTISGRVAVSLPEAGVLERIDASFVSILEPLPGEPRDDEDGVAAFVRRAMRWSLQVQRREGIALADRVEIVPATGAKGPSGTVIFDVVIPCEHPEASHAALLWTQRSIARAQTDSGIAPVRDGGMRAELAALGEVLRRHAEGGQNRSYLAQHALDEELPVNRVVRGVRRIGTGSKSRVLDSSITDRTRSLGVRFASDKIRTAQLLRRAGLPGAEHRLARDPDEAVKIAEAFGYPVVVKPADQEQGRGVFADLRDSANVRWAYGGARKVSNRILVERHFEGAGHRLSIFEGRLYKVTRKLPGAISGDGVSSVRRLVQLAGEDVQGTQSALRGHAPMLTLDDEALGMLAQQGLTPDSVPADGALVVLRRRNNAIAGGSTTTLSPETVHPDNLALGLRAARVLDLDWAGVDLLIPDIGVSWYESGALICEVNAQPQVDRNTAGIILDAMVEGGCVIPVHLVVGASEAIAEPGILQSLADRLGCNGWASRAGLWIDGQRASGVFPDGSQAGRALLDSREVNAALCVMTAAEIVEHGLPVARFDSARLIGSPGQPLARDATLETAISMARSTSGAMFPSPWPLEACPR